MPINDLNDAIAKNLVVGHRFNLGQVNFVVSFIKQNLKRLSLPLSKSKSFAAYDANKSKFLSIGPKSIENGVL